MQCIKVVLFIDGIFLIIVRYFTSGCINDLILELERLKYNNSDLSLCFCKFLTMNSVIMWKRNAILYVVCIIKVKFINIIFFAIFI